MCMTILVYVIRVLKQHQFTTSYFDRGKKVAQFLDLNLPLNLRYNLTLCSKIFLTIKAVYMQMWRQWFGMHTVYAYGMPLFILLRKFYCFAVVPC